MKIIFDTQGKSSQLITIEGCDELENGYYILSHTATGNLQGINLESLDQGVGMFANTTLSSDTLNDIATRIKEYKDGSTHVIDLGNVSDNSTVRDNIEDIEEKGWTVTCNIGTYATCSTVDDVKAIERNYQTVDIDENGVWGEPLPNLEDGEEMFYNCKNLTTFTSDLPSLTDGNRMFCRCENLTSFNADLSSLTSANSMFGSCTKLTEFTFDLSSLIDGNGMFNSCNLESFNGDLSNLTNGSGMFLGCDFTTFTVDLSSLTDGSYMFDGCDNLTSFTSDLSSLTNGYTMFRHCNLNTDSIMNIAKTLQFVNVSTGNIGGRIHIGNIKEFNTDLTAACDLMTFKGWTVQYNDDYVNYERSQNVSDIGDIVEPLQALRQYENKISYRCEEIGVIKMYIDSELKDNSYVKSWLQSIKEKSWTVEEIYITSSDIIKYINCTKPENVSTVDPDYLTNDIVNGIWSEPLPKLQDGNDGEIQKKGMFQENVDLNSFNSDLSSLIDGVNMFYNCSNLTSFNSDLSSLENGASMFDGCSALTSFASDISSLTNGYRMFQNCSQLESFNCDLSSLTVGERMFVGCTNLTSFSADVSGSPVNLSKLTDGNWLFSSCNNLISFNADLGSLKSGYYMFYKCKLDDESLINIANTINDISDLDKDNDDHWTYELLGEIKTTYKSYRGNIYIGHADDVSSRVLQECGNKLIDKGWTPVYFNGTEYEYTPDDSTEYDVSEANGYIPDAYKNRKDSWNTVVLEPNMDVLKISEVNEKGEMLNDD